ncbi:YgfZ/GcvT domain-containing protein [Paracidobacterium acidisoli]|uniref:Folate-binding protein n=1 Tax=Paracidobacterium acidisoli TaxID=2303751 RepID=A0A372IJX1_9BACT|nr:folate-binding protein YgfZ [Paracidobacterium acidisoli]MBT9333061.1 folate-binding protein [Paracidobacterium acidisoli]
MSTTPHLAETAFFSTPLSAQLSSRHPELAQRPYRGSLSPSGFSTQEAELQALLASSGLFDLGCRAFLRVTGDDRLRWLNGMVTNTVQGLADGQMNDSFFLNAQGRILGDAVIYRSADHLLIETDRSQSERLLAHLDHFIIMDDVELQSLDASASVLGIAGPHAASVLMKAGATVPEPMHFLFTSIHGVPVTLAQVYSPGVPRFEIQAPADKILNLWTDLTGDGAVPSGIDALEALRVLEALPLYGTDISDRYLAQETNQNQVLHFSKGCYLGQEIVERIRSRATVHRGLRQFELHGDVPQLAPGQSLPLTAGETAIGELTSVTRITLPGFTHILALGVVRSEAVERGQEISYPGGTATPLTSPPTFTGI